MEIQHQAEAIAREPRLAQITAMNPVDVLTDFMKISGNRELNEDEKSLVTAVWEQVRAEYEEEAKWRLHRLELRGIGPFAACYTIDFDKLSVAGIYLLDGPTGSGKSTIIDAITWALYGGVAGGNDLTSERIRSTHADPKLKAT